MLESLGIDLTPASLIAAKDVVREKDKPRFTKKKLNFQPSNSWMTYMLKKTVQDFQQTVLQVSIIALARILVKYYQYFFILRFLKVLMMKDLCLAFHLFTMSSPVDIIKIITVKDSSLLKDFSIMPC